MPFDLLRLMYATVPLHHMLRKCIKSDALGEIVILSSQVRMADNDDVDNNNHAIKAA